MIDCFVRIDDIYSGNVEDVILHKALESFKTETSRILPLLASISSVTLRPSDFLSSRRC